MSEAMRLRSSVPRGLVRFDTINAQGSVAKPVNDSYDLQLTCSLPPGFAYVMSSLNFELAADTISDFDGVCNVRVFNGLPNGPASSTQSAIFEMPVYPNTVALDPSRILSYSTGSLAWWFHHPLVQTTGTLGMTVLLNFHNSAAAAGAAGVIDFHLALYQYELNQAVRYPLNNPLPVSNR